MNTETKTGAEDIKVAMLMPNMDVAYKTDIIIMNILQTRKEGNLEYLEEIIATGMMTKVMGVMRQEIY